MAARDLFVHSSALGRDAELRQEQRRLWAGRSEDQQDNAGHQQAIAEAKVFSLAAADSLQSFWGDDTGIGP